LGVKRKEAGMVRFDEVTQGTVFKENVKDEAATDWATKLLTELITSIFNYLKSFI
jgi:hypothetical protein